jgi:hypothetical protein
MAAFALVACRIHEAQPRWVEPHGQGQFTAIAASARGLTALGTVPGVYDFPGDWGRNWVPRWQGAAVSVAATDKVSFALTASGEIWRLSGGASPWRTVKGATALYAGPSSELLATVDGELVKVKADSLEKHPCSPNVRSVSTRGSKSYIVKTDGSVWLSEGDRCDAFDVGGPVDDLAVTARSTYVLRGGVPFVVNRGRIVALPRPRVFRNDQSREVSVRALSASAYVLWALSAEGNAFQLLER